MYCTEIEWSLHMKIFAFISPQRFHCKINFLGGLILGGQFWKCTKCEGWSKYLDTRLKGVKLYYDWSKSMFPSKVDKKICFGGSLSPTKCYLYKVWPRNLSAISTTRNVACVYAHMPMHTAETWKKYIDFFISWKHFYHWIGINISQFLLFLC